AYAQALDDSGRILANTNVAMTGKFPKDAFISGAMAADGIVHEYSGEGRSRTVRIAVPVYSGTPMGADDELLVATGLAARERTGTIEAVISLDAVAGVERGLRGSHIYIALTSALVVFLGSLVFFRGGIYQIRRLSEGTDRIKRGDYAVELPVAARDELGELTANFNRMAQILSGTTVSKEYLHSLLENMLDPLFIADTEGRITRVNKAAAALMENGGHRCSICITDLLEPGESGTALSLEVLRREGRVQILDMWFSPGGGKRVPVIAAAAYTAPYAGVKGSISVSLKDLSESIAQKARIKEIQENYRLVVESAPGAIFIQMDGRFEYLNPAALTLFGARGEADLRGKSVRSMFPPDSHDSLRDILESGPGRADRAHNIEAECLRMDGTRFDALISAVRYGVAGKNGALVFMMDMTDRKRTEMELRNMQRIESIGVLAGGIAHDFNNMLTGVTANLSLLQERGPGGADTKEVIRETLGAVSSAQNLTQQLLTFAKGGKP
ncbi:MAG TPA: PAS domain S-box protein, partial [Elusimicrobiales bacterium]|nr:PAS domain S-box protein [Elusimicrobiales bacterium]